jgi:outer membrane lipase/esterase
MHLKKLRSLLLPLALALPLSALAGPFSSLFVFGDSLSDTGNLIDSGVTRPAIFSGPYDGGRFSNGPLWVEGLATGLGLSGQASSFLTWGNNYAFAGSQTGFIPSVGDAIPGLLYQTAVIWGASHAVADPNALYVVVAGGNDMRDARSVFSGTTTNDGLGRQTAAATAISNIQTTIGYLANLGAHNFLVASIPDLGYTPEAIILGLTSASSDASAKFNALVPSVVGWGSGLGLNMNFLDLERLNSDILANPAGFGITSTDSPCAGFANPLTGTVGTTPCANSLFSDVLHPSAYTHSLIASAALKVLGVPEPGSLALLGLGVAALIVVRRRQTA